MEARRHFGIAQREATQIGTMLSDLDRTIRLLERDIALHEASARVKDPAYFGYPLAARTMAARRDKVKMTIAVLERRLSELESTPRGALATVA